MRIFVAGRIGRGIEIRKHRDSKEQKRTEILCVVRSSWASAPLVGGRGGVGGFCGY